MCNSRASGVIGHFARRRMVDYRKWDKLAAELGEDYEKKDEDGKREWISKSLSLSRARARSLAPSLSLALSLLLARAFPLALALTL